MTGKSARLTADHGSYRRYAQPVSAFGPRSNILLPEFVTGLWADSWTGRLERPAHWEHSGKRVALSVQVARLGRRVGLLVMRRSGVRFPKAAPLENSPLPGISAGRLVVLIWRQRPQRPRPEHRDGEYQRGRHGSEIRSVEDEPNAPCRTWAPRAPSQLSTPRPSAMARIDTAACTT